MRKTKFDNEFQMLMEDKLINFKECRQYLPSKSKKSWMYADFSENLFPPIRHGFMQYIYDYAIPLHDYINHVRSSQAYCINTFFYLLQQKSTDLLEFLSNKLNIEIKTLTRFEFEHSPETNFLGEWKDDNNRPEEYVTACDLLILGKSSNGQNVAIIVEVKFTESGFSECGGFNSGGNTNTLRAACDRGQILLENKDLCYLHGCNKKSKLRRKYFNLVNLLDEFAPEAFHGKCPFIHNHQCLRNHSLMNSFIADGYETRFCLVHHEENIAIVKEWDKYLGLLNETSRKKFAKIAGKDIIESVGDDFIKAYYRDRYELTVKT